MRLLYLPSAPRARGGGPPVTVSRSTGLSCSPRTRGWSRTRDTPKDHKSVLPAHAGVVHEFWNIEKDPEECSPRTRGWSPVTRDPPTRHTVLPAHAGMVPA